MQNPRHQPLHRAPGVSSAGGRRRYRAQETRRHAGLQTEAQAQHQYLYNFTTEMFALGLAPSSKVLSFTTVHPPVKIAQTLHLAPGESAFRIERLRMADGEPLLMETAYIPTRICPQLSREQLNDSLYATIRECSGSSPLEAVEIYEAVTLNKRDAELLHMRAGEAAFRIQRISKNTAGEIFEYCVELARGDSNKFQIVLKNSGVQYSRVL